MSKTKSSLKNYRKKANILNPPSSYTYDYGL